MNRLLRYALWVAGTFTILSTLLASYSFIAMQMRNAKISPDSTDLGLEIIATIGSSAQPIAIALLCFFAAHVCKLNEAPGFREDLQRLIKRGRTAGDKTPYHIDSADSQDTAGRS